MQLAITALSAAKHNVRILGYTAYDQTITLLYSELEMFTQKVIQRRDPGLDMLIPHMGSSYSMAIDAYAYTST